MKLENLPSTRIDWAQLPGASQPGARGTAVARTFAAGDVRLRLVEYSPDYLADHWCSKGHLVLVLAGHLTLELQGRPAISVAAGDAVTLGDDDVPHRAVSEVGATAFIVD
jgi:hypothetical protein